MSRRQSLATRILAIAAIATATALSACHKQSASDFISAGDSAVEAQKLEEAEGDYKQAADLAPNDASPHAELGNLYVLEKKQAAAQAEFMRALELDPKDAPMHMALGNLYNEQAQYPMAEAQYRAALAIDPSRSNYHADLGDVLAKEGRPADAQTELRTAIGFDPKNAQAHYELGNLLATMPGHEADAKAEYDQAQQLDPKLVPPTVPTPSAIAATPAPTGVPPAETKVKAINPPRLFLLTHDSPVYANPDTTSAVVANVQHNKYVHVIGIAGKDWLQVRLKKGIVGFIPTSAAQ
jgi:tetratricopeptide (TPR) repeat protein